VKTRADREKVGKICLCSVFHSFAEILGTAVAPKAPDSRCSYKRIIETSLTRQDALEARLR
jgi:hypothetical protein